MDYLLAVSFFIISVFVCIFLLSTVFAHEFFFVFVLIVLIVVVQRGLWRRTTLESYKTKSPEWETVLDIDELNAAEGET